jgi:trigger factor
MEPNEFIKAVDEAGQVPQMVAEVGRRKALAQVLERAVIKDESGNTIDLRSLFPQTEQVDEDAADEAGALQGEADGEQGDDQQAARPAVGDPTALPNF